MATSSRFQTRGSDGSCGGNCVFNSANGLAGAGYRHNKSDANIPPKGGGAPNGGNGIGNSFIICKRKKQKKIVNLTNI